MKTLFTNDQRGWLEEASYPDFSSIVVTPEIEELEALWAGGIADFGDPRAARAVQHAPGYKDYRRSLQRSVRKQLGARFTMYRAMPREAVEELQNGSVLTSYSGFTTLPRVARAWRRFAAHRGPEPVVVRVTIEPGFVIMRGKAAEAELVINNHDIDGSKVEVIS